MEKQEIADSDIDNIEEDALSRFLHGGIEAK